MNWVTASGVEGVESVTVPVGGDQSDERTFDVKLFFAEPTAELEQDREFSVSIQGDSVVEDLQLMKAAEGARRGYVKHIRGVEAKDNIVFKFEANSGAALISGIERRFNSRQLAH